MSIMKNFMNVEGFPNALKRTIKQPLDTSEVWDSLEEAEGYVATGTSYEGQIISVLIDGRYVPYIVQASGELRRATDAEYITGLATVATTGSYLDLSNKPTLASLGGVATTRKINNKALDSDITLTASDVKALPEDTPIPVVNDSILTIVSNSATVATFSANSATNVIATIDVPTVYDWAKATTKPAYNLGEIEDTASYVRMTSDEREKLGGIDTQTLANQNAFANIVVGSATITADAEQDTVTFVAGNNVTLALDEANDQITIAATDTVYTHPSYTDADKKLYKVAVDKLGHVSSVSEVVKADITALGIPAQDTVYTHPDEHPASMITGLATVATTGSYLNLSDRPALTDKTVKLTATIWTDKTIGHINGTTKFPQIVAHKDDTLETMFTRIFGTVEEDTTDLVTNPSISITSIGRSSYEYGTKLDSVSVTVATQSGEYKYGPTPTFPEDKVWTGNYTFSGTGFTATNTSDSNTQTIGLSSTFTVGESASITLSVARNYNAATNYAKSKLGVDTDQTIGGGTASTTATFNPTAAKYVYYAATATSDDPSSWTRYEPATTSIVDLYIPANAGDYVWIAATDEKSYIYAFNEGSGKYNTGDDYVGTRMGSDKSIVNHQGATVSGYCFYRTNNTKGRSGTVRYKISDWTSDKT